MATPASQPGDRTLNPRQQRFAFEYARLGNGAAAARAAGYAPKRADDAAYKLLREPRIQEAVAAARAELRAASRMSPDDIMARLEAIARGSLRDVASWTKQDLRFIPSDELPVDAAGAIKSIKVKHGEFGPSLGIELHDPGKALHLLAQIHGMVGKDGGPGDDDEDGPPNRFIVQDPGDG